MKQQRFSTLKKEESEETTFEFLQNSVNIL